MSNDEMVYSRSGGMTQHELAKIRRRLGGGSTPNASGARQQEAPAILAGSEPSRELVKPKLTPEEEKIAEANRLARAAQPDPVNGILDPLDIEDDDEADLEAAKASTGEPLIPLDPPPSAELDTLDPLNNEPEADKPDALLE